MNKIFLILLNLYLLISIPIYWTPYRWDILQNSYFTFGVLGLFIISEFILIKRRSFRNVWAGVVASISLSSIFLHNYYISDFTEKFAAFSLMSEGFIYILCGILFLKVVYEHGSNRLRDYPVLWGILLIWVIRAVIEKSFSPIVSLVIVTVIYFFRRKQYTIAYFMFLPIMVGILNFWYQMWLKLQCRIWTNIILIKDIFSHPLGQGFNNSLNGNVIFCDMFVKWGKMFNALDNTEAGSLIYPHNDFLNIAKDLGIPVLICVIIGLLFFLKGARDEPLTYLCIAVLLMSCVQTTWYFPNNAVIFIPLFGILGIRKNA